MGDGINNAPALAALDRREHMDQMNYKERLEALRKARFTSLEIERLYQFRRTYMENEMDQAPADLSRL